MDYNSLKQFDLIFPGERINDEDSHRALQNYLFLRRIQDLFIEAVTSYALFQQPIPVTVENIQDIINEDGDKSPYEKCLNRIYAKAFVFAIDSIGKHLKQLTKLHPPKEVKRFHKEFEKHFQSAKKIRDSVSHSEERSLGKYKGELLNTPFINIGCFSGNELGFSGKDGKEYSIAISEVTLKKAKEIIQNIINSYSWMHPTAEELLAHGMASMSGYEEGTSPK